MSKLTTYKPTLQEYYDKVCEATGPSKAEPGSPHCRWCGQPLLLRDMQHEPHPNGWPLAGFKELHWIWLHCSKCKYDWAIWKLGVPRA